jgi:hypothetical protein
MDRFAGFFFPSCGQESPQYLPVFPSDGRSPYGNADGGNRLKAVDTEPKTRYTH